MAYWVWNCQGAQAIPFYGVNQAFGLGYQLGDYYSRNGYQQFWDYARGFSRGQTMYASWFTSKSYAWFNPGGWGTYYNTNGSQNVYIKQNQIIGQTWYIGYNTNNTWVKDCGWSTANGGTGGDGNGNWGGTGATPVYVWGGYQNLINTQGTGYVYGGGGGGGGGRSGSRRYQQAWGGQEPSGGGGGGGGASFGAGGPSLGGRGANSGQGGGYTGGGAPGNSGGGNAGGGGWGGGLNAAGGWAQGGGPGNTGDRTYNMWIY